MAVGMVAACPHCGDENSAGAQFCGSCGKAMPIQSSGGPRVVKGAAFATTTAGQKLQSDELAKTAKKASGALLAVAIIQTVIVAALLGLANVNHRLDVMLRNPAVLGLGGCAFVFWVLFFWARKQPLPAAIVGLVLYLTLVAINVVTSVSQMSADGGRGTRGGFGGIGIGWLDIVIIAVLAKAITAGSQYRKLMQTNPNL